MGGLISLEVVGYILFGICMLVFYYLIYKTNKHTNKQGYSPTFPFPELFKFISDCSRIQKESNDGTLKLLLVSLNSVFVLGAIILMLLVLL